MLIYPSLQKPTILLDLKLLLLTAPFFFLASITSFPSPLLNRRRSFLYNISHTPKERSPHALPCNSNGETAAAKKKIANKANLNPKIRKCSHWCGDLISCYICNPSVFKKLSPSSSLSLVERDRSGDPDETFPTGVHQHPE